MNSFCKISARHIRTVALAAIPLALILGQPPPVSAQTLPSVIVTKMSPEGTSFMSGGVGLEERHKMIGMAEGFDLKLAFADRRGDYLSDVTVTIDDERGKQLLNTTSAGPWLYAELPQGKYDIKASFGNRTEEIKDLEISKGPLVSRLIRWDHADQQLSQR